MGKEKRNEKRERRKERRNKKKERMRKRKKEKEISIQWNLEHKGEKRQDIYRNDMFFYSWNHRS